MFKGLHKTLISSAIFVLAQQAYSQPFFTNDPRAIAMGGAGVSGASTLGSPEYNPALLVTFQEDDDFGFSIAGGTFIMDPQGLGDGIETLTKDTLITNFDRVNDELLPDIENIANGYTDENGQYVPGLVDLTDSLTQSINNLTTLGNFTNLGDIPGNYSPANGTIEQFCANSANDADLTCILYSIDNDSSNLNNNFGQAQTALLDIQDIVNELKAGLVNINNKPLEAYITLSPKIIFPSHNIGTAFNLGTENMLGIKVVIDGQDISKIDGAIADAQGILAAAETANNYIGGNEQQSIVGITGSGQALINLNSNVRAMVDFISGASSLTHEQYLAQNNSQVLQCPLDPACGNYVTTTQMDTSINYFADFANGNTNCIVEDEYMTNLGVLQDLGSPTINGAPLVTINTAPTDVPVCDNTGNPYFDPSVGGIATVNVPAPNQPPTINPDFDQNNVNTYPIDATFNSDLQNAQDDLNESIAQLSSGDCNDADTTALEGVLCYEGNYIGPNDNSELVVKEDSVPQSSDFNSYVEVVGVTINEFGMSVARSFNIKGQDIAFGIKPKVQMLGVVHRRIAVKDQDTLETVTANDVIRDDTLLKLTGNLDFGVAKEFDFYGKVKTGLVIKNIIPHTYDSPIDSKLKIEIRPQVRAGISHHTRLSTIAMDLDITNNQSIAPDFGTPTRMFSIGGEFDLFRWVQLRAGYRANLSSIDTENAYITMGAGFAPFGIVGIDVATWVNSSAIGPAFDAAEAARNVEDSDEGWIDYGVNYGADVVSSIIKDVGVMAQFRVTF